MTAASRTSPHGKSSARNCTRQEGEEHFMFGFSATLWVVVGGMILAIVLLFSFIAQMFRKAGPNEAFIVYGFRGTRVIKGGGTIIFPMFENFRSLSLELMSFDVAPQQSLYTKQGVAVT